MMPATHRNSIHSSHRLPAGLALVAVLFAWPSCTDTIPEVPRTSPPPITIDRLEKFVASALTMANLAPYGWVDPEAEVPRLQDTDAFMIPALQRILTPVRERLRAARPGACNLMKYLLDLTFQLPNLSSARVRYSDFIVPEAELRAIEPLRQRLTSADRAIYRLAFERREELESSPIERALSPSRFYPCDQRAITTPSYPGGETCLTLAMTVDFIATTCSELRGLLPSERDHQVGDFDRNMLFEVDEPWSPFSYEAMYLRNKLQQLLESASDSGLGSFPDLLDSHGTSRQRLRTAAGFKVPSMGCELHNCSADALLWYATNLPGHIAELATATSALAADLGCAFSLDHLRTCADDPYAP